MSLFDSFEEKEDNEIQELLRELSGKCHISMADIKKQYRFLISENLENYFDIVLAAYLLNPLKSDYDGESVAGEHLGLMIPGEKEILGKKSVRDAYKENSQSVAEFYMYQAYVALSARVVLENKLKDAGMLSLMRDVEMPLSYVLYDMEQEGVVVRREELKKYGEALTEKIGQLEKSIYNHAGEQFNINSPKQLGEVLFEHLELPGGKKRKPVILQRPPCWKSWLWSIRL